MLHKTHLTRSVRVGKTLTHQLLCKVMVRASSWDGSRAVQDKPSLPAPVQANEVAPGEAGPSPATQGSGWGRELIHVNPRVGIFCDSQRQTERSQNSCQE